MVALLRQLGIPVIWTLNAKISDDGGWRSPVDVLKQLAFQILQLNALLKQQPIQLNPVRFQSATTESDWFELLGLILAGLPQIHIIVDAEVLSREFSSKLFWPGAFLNLFEELARRGSGAVVKVILISFGASPYMSSEGFDFLENVTIKIDKERRAGTMLRKQRQLSVYRRHGAEALKPFLFRVPG
jgi:hypothetical protein